MRRAVIPFALFPREIAEIHPINRGGVQINKDRKKVPGAGGALTTAQRKEQILCVDAWFQRQQPVGLIAWPA